MPEVAIPWLGPLSTVNLPLHTATLTKWYVVGATLLIVVGQMALIGALLAQRARLRRPHESRRPHRHPEVAAGSAEPALFHLDIAGALSLRAALAG